VDELDFWGGTLFLVLFAAIEIILFSWVYGIDKGWAEMQQGAQMKIPNYYKFIIKYVTPLYLLALLAVWTYQQFWPFIVMRGVAAADQPYQWAARGLVFGLWAVIIALVAWAWHPKRKVVT